MAFEKNIDFELVKALKKTNSEILKQESEIVRKYNITPSQYGVLECLYIKGDMCISELIKKLISTSGTMTVIVKNLEKMKYVTKSINLNDKRYFMVHLTQSGRELVEKLLPEHMKQLNEFASIFTEQDKTELLRILYKVKDKYKEIVCE